MSDCTNAQISEIIRAKIGKLWKNTSVYCIVYLSFISNLFISSTICCHSDLAIFHLLKLVFPHITSGSVQHKLPVQPGVLESHNQLWHTVRTLSSTSTMIESCFVSFQLGSGLDPMILFAMFNEVVVVIVLDE